MKECHFQKFLKVNIEDKSYSILQNRDQRAAMARSESSQLLLFPISCSDEPFEVCQGEMKLLTELGWKEITQGELEETMGSDVQECSKNTYSFPIYNENVYFLLVR